MSIISEERQSDSPYVETITRGITAMDGSTVRPAETHWHMVFTRFRERMMPIFVGPLTSSGVVSYTRGAEVLWIKFKLGVFIPYLLPKNFLDIETMLPEASSNSFWLNGSAWQFPDFENVETFVDRLVREQVLVRDPVVDAALQDQPLKVPSRTVRHRFLQATGLSQNQIRQFERALRAEALLKSGVPILDAVYEAGYYDQPHLTRSLKRWVGHTPAHILEMGLSA